MGTLLISLTLVMVILGLALLWIGAQFANNPIHDRATPKEDDDGDLHYDNDAVAKPLLSEDDTTAPFLPSKKS